MPRTRGRKKEDDAATKKHARHDDAELDDASSEVPTEEEDSPRRNRAQIKQGQVSKQNSETTPRGTPAKNRRRGLISVNIRKKPRHEDKDDDNDYDSSESSVTNKATPRTSARPKKRGRQARNEDNEDEDEEETAKPKKPRNTKSDEYQTVSRESRQSSSPTEFRQIQAGLQSLCTKLAANEYEMEKMQSELHFLREELRHRDKVIKRHETANNQLQAREDAWKTQIRLLEDRNEQSKQSIKSQQERIVELLVQARGDPSGCEIVADATIEGLWCQLVFSIQTLIMKHARDVLEQPLPESTSREIHNTLESCKMQPHLSRYFIQRYLWERLLHEVFDAKGGIWAGSTGESLTAYCRQLKGDLIGRVNDAALCEKLSLSKAQAARQIDQAQGINHEVCASLANMLATELSAFLGPLTSAAMAGFQRQATEIVGQALRLHITFMKSRAFFGLAFPAVVDTQQLNVPDPKTMELCFRPAGVPPQGHVVHFVVTPTLEKIGSADGQDFDLKTVLCKARYVAQSAIQGDGAGSPASTLDAQPTCLEQDLPDAFVSAEDLPERASQSVQDSEPRVADSEKRRKPKSGKLGPIFDRSSPRQFTKNYSRDQMTSPADKQDGAASPMAGSSDAKGRSDDASSSTTNR